MKHSLASFEDLDFLVPPQTERAAGSPLTKFLVFYNNIDECVCTAKHLWARLHPGEQEKVQWFHGQMSDEFHDKSLGELKIQHCMGSVAQIRLAW